MTTLSLTAMWLTRVDSGLSVSAQSDPTKSLLYRQAGENRTYASGRRRSVTKLGEEGVWGFTLINISLSLVTTLRDWKGVTVLARDNRGQAMYGTFREVNVQEWRGLVTFYSAALQLESVTVIEGV